MRFLILLLGRVTYEGMASYYPTDAALREAGEIADLMNASPKSCSPRP
jgi:hypothetical protein